MAYSLNDSRIMLAFFSALSGVYYIRETYEIITQESAEYGDAEERGFIDEEGTSMEFNELVELLKGTEHSGNDWATRYGDMNPITGNVENRSYHPISPLDRIMFNLAWEQANG